MPQDAHVVHVSQTSWTGGQTVKLRIWMVGLLLALVPGAAFGLEADAEVTVERNTVEASPETNTDLEVESGDNTIAADDTKAEVGSGNTATVGGNNQVNPETNTEVSPTTTVNAPVGVNAPVTATDVVDVNGNRILTNESSTTTTTITDNSDRSVRNKVVQDSFNQYEVNEDVIVLERGVIRERRVGGELAFDVSGKALPKTGMEAEGLLLLGVSLVTMGGVLEMAGRRRLVWCR